MKRPDIFKTADSRDILLKRYDAMLAEWPLQPERLEIATSFGRTSVLAWGDEGKPPLVLLHGSMSNAGMWGGEAVTLGRDFRVFAIDILGEPGYSEAVRLDLKTSEPSDWLSQVFDGLHVESAHFAAMSMGAYYAARFAAERPERVNRLVLLCPGGVTPMRLSFIWKAIKLSMFGAHDGADMTRLVFGRVDVSQDFVDYTNLIARHFNAVPNLPLLSDRTLAAIHSPTLFIAGEDDVIFDSRKSAARLKKQVNNCETRLLPDTSHVVLGQAEAIADFLQRE